MTNVQRSYLLYEWLQDGLGYTGGRRLEADNYTLNEKSRMPELSLGAAFILRHIWFSFNLPIKVVAALWSCFYTLIMRRPMLPAIFSSPQTIWNHAMRLQQTDKTTETNAFRRDIRKLTQHGFRRYFYSSSDDSKHHKRNHHVLIISSFDLGCDSSNDWCATPVNPTFRHVCSP